MKIVADLRVSCGKKLLDLRAVARGPIFDRVKEIFCSHRRCQVDDLTICDSILNNRRVCGWRPIWHIYDCVARPIFRNCCIGLPANDENVCSGFRGRPQLRKTRNDARAAMLSPRY